MNFELLKKNAIPIVLSVIATILLIIFIVYSKHPFYTDPEYKTPFSFVSPQVRWNISILIIVLVYSISGYLFYYQISTKQAEMGGLRGSTEFSTLKSDKQLAMEEAEMMKTLIERGESAKERRSKPIHYEKLPSLPSKKQEPSTELKELIERQERRQAKSQEKPTEKAFEKIDMKKTCAEIFEKKKLGKKLHQDEETLWKDVCEKM